MHFPRILVVEDDLALRYIICEVLRDGELEVVEVGSADEAFHYLKTINRIDLVFTDVNTPGSMDGIALANALAAEFPLVKVVITSGRPPPVPLDPIPFIPKPYAVFGVLETIRATL